MNYKKIYESLITRANCRVIDSFTENHHILPRCMGGSNKKANMVRLTPEEHYVAHQLLVKIYPYEPKLVFAAHMMTVKSPTQNRNNKEYGWLRRKFLETNKGISSPSYGRKLSTEHKQIISEANKGKVLSDEHKHIISVTHSGKVVSDDTRHKQSISQTGKKHSTEFCEHRSELVSGINNPMYNNGYKVAGAKNGMFGKSAVKGRRWFYNETGVIYVLPNDPILLDNKWISGRPSKNKTFEELYGPEKANDMKNKQSTKAIIRYKADKK